jgi:hypothetical protein
MIISIYCKIICCKIRYIAKKLKLKNNPELFEINGYCRINGVFFFAQFVHN